MSESTTSQPVIRVARRRAKPGCGPAYEALIGGMLADVRETPGFIGAEVIPPATEDGEHQTILRFETQEGLDAWDSSPVRDAWHERLDAVAEGAPDYQVLTGLEAWFARAEVPGHKPPKRWKMAIVTWLGIWPIVMVLQLVLNPLIEDVPFVPRVAIFTIFVVGLITYVVMPQLVRLFRPWLARH
jgi:antibiotic biosynthesis monooxygenase (ABM) superfamily enzyme